MKNRLQKVVAAAGITSRRKAEELIASGRVTVNGRIARVGESADPEVDVIAVNGRQIILTETSGTFIVLNKPEGYVSSLRSTHGELTVIDLVRIEKRIFPVGRLDRDTSGLLLLTDDGDWANIITHPSYEIEKEYFALVRGIPTRQVLARMREGIRLPDGAITAPARIETRGTVGADTRLSVTVIEGKKRQIRLMGEAIGHRVLRLRRVRVGPIDLGDLPEGQWRHLRQAEVEGIRAHGRRRIERGSAEDMSAGGD